MNGAELLQNPEVDKDFKKWREEVRKLNNEMLINFSAGGTYPGHFEDIINNKLQETLEIYSNKNNVVQLRNAVLSYLKKNIHDPAIFESIMKYWETVKNLEISGESEEE